MIPEQRPSITRSPAFHQVVSQALQETVPVPIVPEDSFAFNAPGNDVMKSPWSIYARFAWHKSLIPEIYRAVNL